MFSCAVSLDISADRWPIPKKNVHNRSVVEYRTVLVDDIRVSEIPESVSLINEEPKKKNRSQWICFYKEDISYYVSSTLLPTLSW